VHINKHAPCMAQTTSCQSGNVARDRYSGTSWKSSRMPGHDCAMDGR
jgi:hypothetical protein